MIDLLERAEQFWEKGRQQQAISRIQSLASTGNENDKRKALDFVVRHSPGAFYLLVEDMFDGWNIPEQCENFWMIEEYPEEAQKEVVPFVMEKLLAGGKEDREYASYILRHFRENASSAVPELVEIVKAKALGYDDSLAKDTMRILLCIGEEADVAVPYLKKIVESEKASGIANVAVRTLEGIGGNRLEGN